MRRISSASCARHLRVTMCLVIFITGSTSSSATSSAGRRPGRLTMVNASSVLWHFHLMVQRHLLGPSSPHRSVNTSLSVVLYQSLGISSHGPAASPWSLITSWIIEHLIVLCPSSVLRHLISWSRGISLVLHHFIDQ